jgi:ElaB/YqjD/DUF883 family membrane-anchored ribosome-binding protein
MSNMTEFVQSMISDLENIQRIVSIKLNELKQFAKEQGVEFESKQYVASSSKSSIAMEIEQQRKSMMEQMQKIRDEAQQQAQKAMEEAKRYSSSIPSSGMSSMPTGMPVVNMPNFGVPNINIEDVKEKKDV